MAFTIQPIPDIPLIQPGDNLAALLLEGIARAGIQPENGDIFVLAQKIVSKAEGRLVNLNEVTPSDRAVEYAGLVEKDARFIELVLQESREVLRVRQGTIIVEHRNGFICANAGIDHSNVKGPWGNPEDWVLLLPDDPDASARKIRQELECKDRKAIRSGHHQLAWQGLAAGYGWHRNRNSRGARAGGYAWKTRSIWLSFAGDFNRRRG